MFSKIFKSFLAAAVLFVSVCGSAEELKPKVTKLDIDSPKQVLFVGNSYFYYNDSLHNKVLGLAKAADKANEKKYKFKSVTVSGGSLKDHVVSNYVADGAFGFDKPFDVVILADNSASQISPKIHEEFVRMVKEHDKAIKASGARTVLFMTWAYGKKHKKYSPEMIKKNRAGYTEMGNSINALVIPAGLAFEEAANKKKGIKLHQSYDGSHPTEIGHYLVACVTYASLYGKSPVGLNFDDHGKVKKNMARFLQTVAWDTVKKYYGK